MLEFSRGANRNVDTWDQNIFQGSPTSCAVRSQQIIMRDFGIQISEEQLLDYAEAQGWYNPVSGTKTKYIGNLLESCNIGVHTSYDNTVVDLLEELRNGHRVIVSVDPKELWAEPGSEEWQFYESIDKTGHALIVAGAKIDPNNPEKSTIILTDPGRGDVFIEYDLKHFVLAWKDSAFYMMATNEPAPFQYNELTKQMEPSNFFTTYELPSLPFCNEFTEIYHVDDLVGYVPYYNEFNVCDFDDAILSLDDLLTDFNNVPINDSFMEDVSTIY